MTTTFAQEELADAVAEANSVLLLSPSMSDAGEDACIDLLQPVAPEAENMLWVSYTKPPDAQLQRWRAHSDTQPDNLGIVSVEESTRSVSAASPAPQEPLPGSGPVETVSNPNDLTGLGITITEYLTGWDDNDNRTVVCFDSLTALLQYVELETAFEFLHVLTGRLTALDAFAHFHMDPGAHERQTIEIIATLVDAVVEPVDDGFRVRSRPKL